MEKLNMPQLTVTEKNHWKARITRKIEQAIEALYANEQPQFLEALRREANQRAIASLGLTELKAAVEAIEQQKAALDKKRKLAYREMVALVEGKPVEDIHTDYYCQPYEVERAIARRANIHEQEILEGTELGRRILTLTQEKEELLDTVWLATSGKQIKQLWQKMSTLLDQRPTPFQEEALQIDPVDDD
jgi:hypothetical protein